MLFPIASLLPAERRLRAIGAVLVLLWLLVLQALRQNPRAAAGQ